MKLLSFKQPFYCNNLLFILLAAGFFTVFQNIALWARLWPLLHWHGLYDYLFALTMPLFVFAVLSCLFLLFLQDRFARPLLVALLLISAAVNYFCLTYTVVIDKDMIRQVLHASGQQVWALLTPGLFTWEILLGVVPALAVWRSRLIKHPSWWYNTGLRIAGVLGSFCIIALIAILFFRDYASLVHNNKPLIKLLTPTNFISSTYGYFRQEVNRYIQ